MQKAMKNMNKAMKNMNKAIPTKTFLKPTTISLIFITPPHTKTTTMATTESTPPLPTPRTDAAANESIVRVYDESQKLERELAAATRELARLRLVMATNKPGMDRAQKMLDAGRWAGLTLIEGVVTELEEARATISEMEIRHAAVMRHTQSLVDALEALRVAVKGGSDE
jgi:hypothetical protein